MNVVRLVSRCLAGIVVCASLLSLQASAQGADTGPIKILVGFPAGGTIDVVTRQVADAMHETLGVPIVVETLSGAGGQLAAQALKRAAPDGRTLMVAPDHTAVIIPLTLKNPGYDMTTDFAPIGMVADYAGALAVSQASGIKDMAGFMSYVKSHPEAGNVGVSAPGSKPQFQLAALSKRQGVTIGSVPYRGSVPMVQDLAGGHLTAGITALGDFLEFERAGKLKVIAMTGDHRSSLLPDVPTSTEAGYPIPMNFWIGMFAPAGTPAATVARLNQALNAAMDTRPVKDRMAGLVFDPVKGTPAELSRRVEAEMKTWAPLIEASGWTRQ